jgi:hypothetical protein
MWVAVAIIFAALGAVVVTVLAILMVVLSALYFYWVRHRIPFTQALLAACSTALQRNSGPISVSLFFLIATVAWYIFWGFTAASLIHYSNSSFLIFLIVLSLYWTTQVIQNVAHTTTAGERSRAAAPALARALSSPRRPQA